MNPKPRREPQLPHNSPTNASLNFSLRPPPSATPGSPGRFPPAAAGFTALFTRLPPCRQLPGGGGDPDPPSPSLTVLATCTKRRSQVPHSRGAHCGEEARGEHCARSPLQPARPFPPSLPPGAHGVPRRAAAWRLRPSRLPAAQHGLRAARVPPHAAQISGSGRQQREEKQQQRRHGGSDTQPGGGEPTPRPARGPGLPAHRGRLRSDGRRVAGVAR